MTETEAIISAILDKTEPFMSQTDSLSRETAAGVYETLGEAAKMSCNFVDGINSEIPGMRAELCDRQDKILERLVDIGFGFKNPEIGIYTPAVQGYRRWGNVELMKDKGLTGYTLAKEIGAKPYMFFGSKPDDYPYAKELSGMEIIYDEPLGGGIPFRTHITLI